MFVIEEWLPDGILHLECQNCGMWEQQPDSVPRRKFTCFKFYPETESFTCIDCEE